MSTYVLVKLVVLPGYKYRLSHLFMPTEIKYVLIQSMYEIIYTCFDFSRVLQVVDREKFTHH
jgi:hypothetical protein